MATAVTNDVLSIRIPSTLIKSLDKLAVMMDRSKSYVAEQAISEYVDENTWLLEEARVGLKDIEEGRVISSKEMDKFFANLIKDIRSKK